MLFLAEATAYDLSSFLSAFTSFVTSVVGVWTNIIGTMLSTANFILIIPILVYIFVVATASLRSFYKG